MEIYLPSSLPRTITNPFSIQWLTLHSSANRAQPPGKISAPGLLAPRTVSMSVGLVFL